MPKRSLEEIRRALADTVALTVARLSDPSRSGCSLVAKFCKIDTIRREVEGIVCTENPGEIDEILSYEGSRAAFTEALKRSVDGQIGIDEMGVEEVGRSTSVEFLDNQRAIKVRARISKNAENCWLKICDGTLGYFQCSGRRLISELRKDGSRITSRWALQGISLVDTPNDPQCTVSIATMIGGSMQGSSILMKRSEATRSCPTQIPAPRRKQITRCPAFSS